MTKRSLHILRREDNPVGHEGGGHAGDAGHDDVVVGQAGHLHYLAHDERQPDLGNIYIVRLATTHSPASLWLTCER